ncbi:basic proline-rich protein-like [Phacochoerus africanus]|uniref:basic proline-rich protein-like n=1 Tax=Phacochoerus africanus TaxID=41426 RepID=UPI001FD9464D|nr:basic proline-rich protein-like [Phacochoerus africanus]
MRFIRSKTPELAGGPGPLRASLVLISGLISLRQEDTSLLPGGGGGVSRKGRGEDGRDGGEPSKALAPRPTAPHLPGLARSSARSLAARSLRLAGHLFRPAAAEKSPQRLPASHPRPGPRRAASNGATWRPGSRLPPRPGLTAPRLPGLTSLPPRRLSPGWVAAGPPTIPMGTGLRPGLPCAGPPRPGFPPGAATVLATAEGPRGRPLPRWRSCSERGQGSLLVPQPGREGLQIANSSRLWRKQLWQSRLGRRLRQETPPPSPTPTRPVPRCVVTDYSPVFFTRL